ncbi:hypothetical protein [Frankia tisae]|uniref:hypothetical protein n=1 Tax=Frankia tisae TaxID=2950104 RepID=UPI0021BFA987|nr:hypothetical protein [Frankia tisae]
MSGSPDFADRGTVRLLVVLVIVMSAVAAFAVGGLIAVSGVRVSWGGNGDGGGPAGALPAAIGSLGAGDAPGLATRPSSDIAAPPEPTPAAPTPTTPSGAVKHPVSDADSPALATPAPLRSCTAPPTAAAGGAGTPILIYPLC